MNNPLFEPSDRDIYIALVAGAVLLVFTLLALAPYAYFFPHKFKEDYPSLKRWAIGIGVAITMLMMGTYIGAEKVVEKIRQHSEVLSQNPSLAGDIADEMKSHAVAAMVFGVGLVGFFLFVVPLLKKLVIWGERRREKRNPVGLAVSE